MRTSLGSPRLKENTIRKIILHETGNGKKRITSRKLKKRLFGNGGGDVGGGGTCHAVISAKFPVGLYEVNL